MFGKNAGKVDTAEHNIKDLYKELQEKGCIVEDMICQNQQLADFNPTSVNTFRVVTLLCADGNLKVMAAVLRIGRKGKTADNFHHYGIAATIDVEKGIVNAPGIDREFKRYIVHPDSGKQIIGFKVPSWDRIVDLVTSAAKVIPEVRYVGWDVAVDQEGNTQLIEGNYGADPDVTQMPCRIGAWPAFQEELDMIKETRPV